MKKEVKKTSVWWWLSILIVLIFGLALLIPFSYTAKEQYQESVPYETQVSYQEKVPYTDTEYYYETVSVPRQECDEVNMLYKIEYYGTRQECANTICAQKETYCVDTNFWGNCVEYRDRCIREECSKYTHYCGLKIENKEREQAYFRIEEYDYNNDNTNTNRINTESVYVSALDTRYIYWSFSHPADEAHNCWYKIIDSPKMDECKTVMDTKQEQRSRTVTKYRTETKTKTEVRTKCVSKEREVTKKTNLIKMMMGETIYYFNVGGC